MKIKKAVILGAGYGTRFLPITKSIPKPMLPIIDQPIIMKLVEEALASGIEEIIIVVKELNSLINHYFNLDEDLEDYLMSQKKIDYLNLIRKIPTTPQIKFVKQIKTGTGGAVLSTKDIIGEEPFVVIFGDDYMVSDIPVTKMLLDEYEKTGNMQIAALGISEDKVSRYGILNIEQSGYINQIIEKPNLTDAPSLFAGIGRFLVVPEIFKYLEKAPVHRNGETSLPETMMIMANNGYKVNAVKHQSQYFDLGNKTDYIKALINESLVREEMREEIITYMKEMIK